jgi:hypothetical protein
MPTNYHLTHQLKAKKCKKNKNFGEVGNPLPTVPTFQNKKKKNLTARPPNAHCISAQRRPSAVRRSAGPDPLPRDLPTPSTVIRSQIRTEPLLPGSLPFAGRSPLSPVWWCGFHGLRRFGCLGRGHCRGSVVGGWGWVSIFHLSPSLDLSSVRVPSPRSCRSGRGVAAELEVRTPGRNTSQATPRLPIRSSSVRCRSVRLPTPWSCRSGSGVAAELEVRLGRVGQWLGGGFLEGRRMIRCFCLHLHVCVFFCFMLICQLAIGGQKGGGFCHHRIEVISI